MYEQGLHCYEDALNSFPTNTLILQNCSVVLVKIEKLDLAEKHNKKNLSEIKISLSSQRIARAEYYLKKAIEFGQDATSFSLYANFLEDCDSLDKAETNYLSALDKNPDHIYCLTRYGNFLQNFRKDELNALSFFERAQKVSMMSKKKENDK